MEIPELRKRLTNGKIAEVLKQLQALVPQQFQNDISLLQSEFSDWERQSLMGLGPRPEARNRIIYATLYYISKTEEKQTQGRASLKAGALAGMEKELTLGYGQLYQLRQKKDLDKMLEWLDLHHPKAFESVLVAEKTHPHPPIFREFLIQLDWSPFLNLHQLEANSEQIIHFLLLQQKQIPHFLTGWIGYANYRQKFSQELVTEIERVKSKRTKLFQAGLIGGLIGSIGSQFLAGSITRIIEQYSNGQNTVDEPPEEINWGGDDD